MIIFSNISRVSNLAYLHKNTVKSNMTYAKPCKTVRKSASINRQWRLQTIYHTFGIFSHVHHVTKHNVFTHECHTW